MSNSYKKNPILKSGRWLKKLYWKLIRNNWKNIIKSNDPENLEFENPKAIVNDYEHCDQISICTKDNCYCMKIYGRKKCLEK